MPQPPILVPQVIASDLIPQAIAQGQRVHSNTSVIGVKDHMEQNFAPQNSSQKLKLTTALPTPINPHNLSVVLRGYPQASTIVRGFTHGFSLHYEGPDHSLELRNSVSAHRHSSFLENYIGSELHQGRIAGPFISPPFSHFVVSPIAVVPKKVPGTFRVIHDLSQPKPGSVNSFIPDSFARVQYETFDNVVNLVLSHGTACLLAKCDVKEGFRNLPVSPSDYHLLGFKFKNLYYYDKVVPMGARSSCNIFEQFSTSLQWVVNSVYNFHSVTHILDDFIFVGPNASSECMRGLKAFLCLAKFIGLPIKSSKTIHPSTQITVHGIFLDTQLMTATIPQDKIDKALSLIRLFTDTNVLSLRQLQSLCGLLNFCCKCIKPGRAFLRRLWDLLIDHSSCDKSALQIHLTPDALQDLRVWSIFLQQFNGISILAARQWEISTKLHLFTDASKTGFGFCFGSQWCNGRWPQNLSELTIMILEFIPIIMCVEYFSPYFTNKGLILHIDNLALVHSINSQTSKCPTVMGLIRRLVVRQLVSNISLHAVYIPSKQNIVADLLSRSRVEQARNVAPFLEKHPIVLPDKLLPQSLLHAI